MKSGGRILGAAAAAFATLAIGAASRAPWGASPADRALLRLSWRAPSEVAERCRPLSEEEKADLPVHMRVPEICETRAIPYLLRIRVDGVTIAADTIQGAGAREDRPVTVFREISVSVGERAIDIAFRPLVHARDADDDGDGKDGDEDGEVDGDEEDEEEGEADEVAVELVYSETLALGPREVALLTLDPARGVLVRVESP